MSEVAEDTRATRDPGRWCSHCPPARGDVERITGLSPPVAAAVLRMPVSRGEQASLTLVRVVGDRGAG